MQYLLIFCSYKAEVANKLKFEFLEPHQLMFEPQLSLRENLNHASPGWHKPVIPATQEAAAGGIANSRPACSNQQNLASSFKK